LKSEQIMRGGISLKPLGRREETDIKRNKSFAADTQSGVQDKITMTRSEKLMTNGGEGKGWQCVGN